MNKRKEEYRFKIESYTLYPQDVCRKWRVAIRHRNKWVIVGQCFGSAFSCLKWLNEHSIDYIRHIDGVAWK